MIRFLAPALFSALLLGMAATPEALAQEAPSEQSTVVGRWNLTIQTAQGAAPAWLEVSRSGPGLVGQYVGSVGSARPISRIDAEGGELRFTIPAQYERGGGDLVVAGRLTGGQLRGHLTVGDGPRLEWTGSRAPTLRREATPQWGDPVPLIQQGSLAGWRLVSGTNQWEVVDGVLRNRQSGGNLVTDREFDDFQLHVEFRVPEGSNSGIYLRGRYEVQIVGSSSTAPETGSLGAVYGFLAPSEIPVRPGDWQTFDITLVGRRVTVALNGVTVICDREIPGITGGALDSDEGTPGPLMLQGDHGPIEFRNIVITPAR